MNIENINKKVIGCRKCTELIEYRNSRPVPPLFKNCTYWNRPVAGYGDIHGNLLVIGLAPAFNGGNRTGRIFTGDKSSDFLISSLYSAGFTNIPSSREINDGLEYRNMYITLALRCAPPGNMPSRDELNKCYPYLEDEINSMENLRAILVLGKIAFDSALKYFRNKNIKLKGIKFHHGAFYDIENIRLFCSYHPSPRNVNTGILNAEKLTALLNEIKNFIS
ncbi:MAG: uracil-DNA glycosylase [Ferroplasma sp.]